MQSMTRRSFVALGLAAGGMAAISTGSGVHEMPDQVEDWIDSQTPQG